MSGLPSGTITFLFTDIEGSARQWEQMPEPMANALERHDAVLREAIESHGGKVFKTVGDAFCAAFSKASSALHSALDIQRGLSHLDSEPVQLKVRMAMHSGTAEERGGDYFGPTLNRTARILAVGHGSQVLLSEVSHSLTRESLPSGGSLDSLGVHRLKDLGLPETIYQFRHPDLPANFPPLKSLGTHSNTLPQYLSRFIGREKEIDLVRQIATESRLATLTGSGGCGKTRLATQAAADLTDYFPDGVWFFEFAPLSDPAAIPSAIAETLSIKAAPPETPLQAVQRAIKDQSMLLIFDNCEHVLDEASDAAITLLKSCPKIRILATSREALGIDGERAYRVPSLQTPSPVQTDALALMQCESVQLFIDRAQLSNPEFDVDDAQGKSVAAICSRLDGIPLAIELAAARTRVMSVQQIERNLDQRFRLLTGGSRSALPRQQTLRSLIDWSHALLSEQEKALFRRLSVFAGSWTLDAAEAVCAGGDFASWEVIDLLAGLIDKSLVVRIERTSPDRYRFLETIRQYAREHLMASQDGLQMRCKHLEYFAARAIELHPNPMETLRARVGKSFSDDQENFEAAQEFAEGQEDLSAYAVSLANCLNPHWWQVGRLRFGLHHLESALKFCGEISRDRATGLLQVGRTKYILGDYEDSKALVVEARRVFANLGDMEGVCYSMNSQANAMRSLGDPDHIQVQHEALELAQQFGLERLEGILTANIALRAFYSGDLELARAGMQRAHELAQRADEPLRQAVCLNNFAEISAACGDIEHAKRLYLQALEIIIEERLIGPSTYSFDGIAHIGFVEGRFLDSVRLVACAKSVRESRTHWITPDERHAVDSLIDDLRNKVTPEEFDTAWQAGSLMTVEEGWAFGQTMLSLSSTP